MKIAFGWKIFWFFFCLDYELFLENDFIQGELFELRIMCTGKWLLKNTDQTKIQTIKHYAAWQGLTMFFSRKPVLNDH